ncbi:type VII toxin-antitoxin system MntA family adenylyltransferase antitoxin [Geotalea uraniireducens]|uniref:DNA polymerase, beta domain protein region n=1 Tax=Geotalea uraniireducens (strain Rf4) TaxID=351605 RepID=A5GF46_GEOUR|nr:nucleotidyltransferase domain-containing protein [Geotalea uraniireducens]ABQ26051.1 DNA polymerase, beta domain protein region [Geotalea uraniireducens Rf4]
MDLTDIEKIVADYCAGRAEIAACYLYGSYARGEARSDSDVDLAFLLDVSVPRSHYGSLRMDYYSGLSFLTRKEPHVLVINDAGELVLGEVLREGVMVFVRDEEALDAFVARKIPLIAEFSYYSELFRRKLVERYGEVDNG